MQFYAENDAIIYSIQRTFLPLSAILLRSSSELAIWLEVSLQVNLKCPFKWNEDTTTISVEWMVSGDGSDGTSSVRQVRPGICCPIKFCQGLPIFRGAVVLHRHHKEYVNHENLIRFFRWELTLKKKKKKNALNGGQFTLSAQVDETKLSY